LAALVLCGASACAADRGVGNAETAWAQAPDLAAVIAWAGAEGLATVFGGNLAVMDLMAAQRLLGKDRRVDQVDVLLRPDANVAAV
jgi:hypothetical protein